MSFSTKPAQLIKPFETDNFDEFLFILKKKKAIYGELTSKQKQNLVKQIMEFVSKNTALLQSELEQNSDTKLLKFSNRIKKLFEKLSADNLYNIPDLAKLVNQINRLLNKNLLIDCKFTPYTILGQKGKRFIIPQINIKTHNSESLHKCFDSSFGKNDMLNLSKEYSNSAIEAISHYLLSNPHGKNSITLENVSEVFDFALQHDLKMLIRNCSEFCREEMKKAVADTSEVTAEHFYSQVISPILKTFDDGDVEFKLNTVNKDNNFLFPEYPLYEAEHIYRFKKIENINPSENLSLSETEKLAESLEEKDGLDFERTLVRICNSLTSHINDAWNGRNLLNRASTIQKILKILNNLRFIPQFLYKTLMTKLSLFINNNNISLKIATIRNPEYSACNAVFQNIEDFKSMITNIKHHNILFFLNYMVINVNKRILSDCIIHLSGEFSKEQLEKINILVYSGSIEHDEYILRETCKMICSLRNEHHGITLPNIRYIRKCDNYPCLIQSTSSNILSPSDSDEKEKE